MQARHVQEVLSTYRVLITLERGDAGGSAADARKQAFPDTDLGQGYGMTELGGAATHLTPEDHRCGDRLRSAASRRGSQRGSNRRRSRGSPSGTLGEILIVAAAT